VTDAVAIHRALLEKWRSAMDLVGPGPLDPHFADAAAAVGWLDARGEWVDLGSGAGFPGIALASCFPAAKVHLVERRLKRAVFLEQVVRAAGLTNARVSQMDVSYLPSSSFDGVISRAFAPPSVVLAAARRLLRAGGRVVLLVTEEIPALQDGFLPCHVERYEIDGRPRAAVAFRRVAE
jgi:16S rRNA (guanine527-N7)-methyltransferase